MPAFFVTGTDTEVGKTFVSTALLNAARLQGYQTLGLKPIAAGCISTADGLRNEDALSHMASSTVKLPYQSVNPVALEPAIAPHIAAEDIGVSLSVLELAKHCKTHLAVDNFSLVEGAGGWLVPLDDRHTFADLAIELGLPVVLVVGLRLGCINHALLTVEAIVSAGLPLAGWVANSSQHSMERERENILTLEKRIPAPCLGHVPWSSIDVATQTLTLEPLLAEDPDE